MENKLTMGSGKIRFGFEQEHSRSVYDLSNPIVTCPPPGKLDRVGEGVVSNGILDGYKFLCNVRSLTAPCLVVSLGR